MSMLYLGNFVPFLHVDTPKPDIVQRKILPNFRKTDEHYPDKLIEEVLEYREELHSI